MRRLLAALGLSLAALVAIGGPAAADPLPRCVLIPDGDGHVKEFCRR